MKKVTLLKVTYFKNMWAENYLKIKYIYFYKPERFVFLSDEEGSE